MKAVLAERRYIDIDYRSEHSRFYSTTFVRYPSVCHRLHFFTDDIDLSVEELDRSPLVRCVERLRERGAYRGYSILRPLPTSPVGRTMIAPPPSLRTAALATVDDTVHLFGVDFRISGVPFISQDAQFSRCAHAAMWVTLNHAHLSYGAPRRLPSDIHDATIGGESLGRHIPSGGLSPAQMMRGLERLGLAPIQIMLPSTRRRSRRSNRMSLFATLCRYVNSQMPPIVYSEDHAWVVVGYSRSGHGHDHIHLYRHDDVRGPYLRVDDPWREPDESHRPWVATVPPLPQKVYLTGERAELIGREVFERAVPVAGSGARALIGRRRIKWRTYAIHSTEYKASLAGRLPEALGDPYRLAQWPRYIWVVEAHDDSLRDTGRPSCIGEVIVDATAHHLEDDEPGLAVLGVHAAGELVLSPPDHNTLRWAEYALTQPYESGCPVTSSLRIS